MNIKKAPKGFVVTLFVLVFIVYTFQAYKREFEQKWHTIQIGDVKTEIIELVGEPFKETHYVEDRKIDTQLNQESETKAASYSYWMVGVEASYIIGFDANDFAVYIFPRKQR